jgi:hypothetical protein
MTDLLDEIRQRADARNYASVGGAVTMTAAIEYTPVAASTATLTTTEGPAG